jgi:hypothetical protein
VKFFSVLDEKISFVHKLDYITNSVQVQA